MFLIVRMIDGLLILAHGIAGKMDLVELEADGITVGRICGQPYVLQL